MSSAAAITPLAVEAGSALTPLSRPAGFALSAAALPKATASSDLVTALDNTRPMTADAVAGVARSSSAGNRSDYQDLPHRPDVGAREADLHRGGGAAFGHG